MKKRAIATFLWLYAAWYATALVGNIVGFGAGAAPAVAFVVGAFVGLDPLGRIWRVRDRDRGPVTRAGRVGVEAA